MAGFPAVIDLSTLDGRNGFRLDGIDASDLSGRSVSSAGDVNGDGFGDILIGADGGDPGGDSSAGESYVVFGKASGFTAGFDLSTLDGSDGFRLDGIDAFDYSGRSVSSAGDVNGDGFDDILIGAFGADPIGIYNFGESYVVFGKASGFAASLDLSTLDGSNGFRLDGIDPYDLSGRSVSSAGDVNGDGFDDIIIGAPGGNSFAGESYVVFGKASGFTAGFDLSTLDGSNGFRLDGIDASDSSGRSVSSAGDVNGDGFDDIIIGAYKSDPGGDPSAGESYVVFGKASGFAAGIGLASLDGSNGFRLDGIDALDFSGRSVSSAGDVNGDGFDDIIIGAYQGDPGGDTSAGESYVVFGKASGFAASIDLSTLDGSNGFRLDGIDPGDRSGYSVSSAGDFNGDGFDDIIIGAYKSDPGGDTDAGESYVVFGKASGFAASIDLSTLDGSNGFRLDGIDASDLSGRSVSSAGDVNGDGFDDIIIGANGGDPVGDSSAGESYVVFGIAPSDVVRNGTVAGETLAGGFGDDILDGKGGDDDLFGNDGDDVLRGGSGDDSLGGGTGDDNLDGGSGNDDLNGGDGDDDITGGAGDDIIDGGTGLGRDIMDGGSGLDTFMISAGKDRIDGGSGFDTIDLVAFNGGATGINVNLFGEKLFTLDGDRQTIIDIEKVIGTDQADTLQGDIYNNQLLGGDGDDVIRGSAGNDTLKGQNGADNVNGGEGDDTLFGGADADSLNGSAGNDTLYGDAGADSLFGALGDDTLNGGSEDDLLRGNEGVDILNGDAGSDDLRGGAGGDTLDGGDGTDFLFGEDGNDILQGGVGDDADSMTGGTGADTFIYKNAADGGGGFDRIKDFENGTDFIDLRSFSFSNFNLDIVPLSTQVGSGVKVNFGSGDVLFIENLLLADWDAGDVLT